ncbi:hypothetical protein DPMN_173839 [Dreissena polymorpha]|uniref:Uncharacterized protein n=1 Tax=Dreissena polymorpha TaxID=45954 RepID=A0A9D4E5C6_DREPO|nr:hypothetical protein DPMN_173839 [Dreissena polymorpha]
MDMTVSDRPGTPRTRIGTIRRLFGGFKRRRSSKDHPPDENTLSTQINTDSPGSNIKATRRSHGLLQTNKADLLIKE